MAIVLMLYSHTRIVTKVNIFLPSEYCLLLSPLEISNVTELRMILPNREYLAKPGNIFGFTTEVDATGI